MSRTRLLIADVPPILSGIVHELVAGHAEIEVVADIEAAADLIEAARRCRADVVVTRASAPSELWDRLLSVRPRVRVLTVSEDGRVAWLQRLVPQRITMVDVSPQQLLAAITGSVAPQVWT